MKRKGIVGLITGTLIAGLAAGYWAGWARAGGVPSPMPLTYSGTLTDAFGKSQPMKTVSVQLFTDNMGMLSACPSATAPNPTDANGRFSVQLGDQCTQAVHDNPNLYVQVAVAGHGPLASQQLPRLNAVPYALEADTASKAANAAPDSGLDNRISALENPSTILGEFNAATTDGGVATLGALSYAQPQYDLAWMAVHSAAAAACNALAMSVKATFINAIPAPVGMICTDACTMNNNNASCLGKIVLGDVLPKQAKSNTDVVATTIQYDCSTANQGGSEVGAPVPPANPGSAFGYCCCY